MGRRARWITCAVIATGAIVIAAWPRHDDYGFLRDMGAKEIWFQNVHLFAFPGKDLAEIEAEVGRRWKRDRPHSVTRGIYFATPSSKWASLYEVRRPGQLSEARVDIGEEAPWWKRQLDAFESFLHLG